MTLAGLVELLQDGQEILLMNLKLIDNEVRARKNTGRKPSAMERIPAYSISLGLPANFLAARA